MNFIIEKKAYQEAIKNDNYKSYHDFIKHYPNSIYKSEVNEKLKEYKKFKANKSTLITWDQLETKFNWDRMLPTTFTGDMRVKGNYVYFGPSSENSLGNIDVYGRMRLHQNYFFMGKGIYIEPDTVIVYPMKR